MKFKDYITERGSTKYEDSGVTSKDAGHKHEFFIKRMTGDGGTSKDAGHLHLIKKMIVLPAKDVKNDHIHKLDKVTG